MSNQRRLGRGLEALLGRSLDEAAAQPAAPTDAASPAAAADPADNQPIDSHMTRDAEGQRWLDLGVIERNPQQPRKEFDEEEIADLADSIREHGVLQPIVVRRIDGRFELVAGERRLRAMQSLDWKQAPVQVRDLEDRETAELALVENLQRKDLNPIEKATSFDNYLRNYDCTQEELARRVSLKRSTVANLIRLLELPDAVKQLVVAGELTQGHARALLAIPEARRVEAAQRVVREGLSVRKVEQLGQDFAAEGAEETLRVVGEDGVSRTQPAARSAQLAALEQELATALGIKVALSQNAKGAGKITLSFKGHDEFDRLRSLLTSPAGRSAAA